MRRDLYLRNLEKEEVFLDWSEAEKMSSCRHDALRASGLEADRDGDGDTPRHLQNIVVPDMELVDKAWRSLQTDAPASTSTSDKASLLLVQS
jgi:hypothetical protein